MNHGFVKVATAIPSLKVADCYYNVQQIESLTLQASGKGVEIICFPELCMTGYTCADLFQQELLLEECENAVMKLLTTTRSLDIIAIVGIPLPFNGTLLNCALVLQKGKVLAIIPKTYLPNYKEFYEKRWFTSGLNHIPSEVRYCGQRVLVSSKQIIHTPQCNFAVELCEDVWAPIPPSSSLALNGAEIIFNLSASNESIGKNNYLTSLISQQSARCISAYVYSSAGFGESTTDLVFAGNGLIYENGTLLAKSERFSLSEQLIISEIDVEKLRVERRTNSTYVNAQRVVRKISEDIHVINMLNIKPREFKFIRDVDPLPFIPKGDDMKKSCEEIFNIQVMGLAKRVVHTHSKRLIIGISGGLDSTLALLVCVKTFDRLKMPRKDIIGVTMPGFGTTDRTYRNAIAMMEQLGVTIKEIRIANAVVQHFKDIGHNIDIHDVTYENSQARERTQILMDLSNKLGGLVVGTGDLSELALGWATYNGDHMSMYGVNASVPKTLIRYLVKYVAEEERNGKHGEDTYNVLMDVIDTPISPELIPADKSGKIQQKTEELVGPYELHDFFLYYFLRFGFTPRKIFIMAQHAFNGSHSDAATYDSNTIKKWLTVFMRRFFAQQFKRSCLPDGPKVGSVSLSPRGDWRMPTDASSDLWLKECEKL